MAELWNHRCTQPEGSNHISGCVAALDKGYKGIEVDFQFFNNSFFMHHDHYYLSNETMQMLFDALSSRDYSIWIDLKTQSEESVTAMIQRLEQNNMLYRSMVEIENEFIDWIPEGVKYGVYSPGTEGGGNVIIKQAEFLTADVIKTSELPIYTYHASPENTMLGMLRKDDVMLSHAYEPFDPSYPWIFTPVITLVPLTLVLICVCYYVCSRRPCNRIR
jgi:hypothetical protein